MKAEEALKISKGTRLGPESSQIQVLANEIWATAKAGRFSLILHGWHLKTNTVVWLNENGYLWFKDEDKGQTLITWEFAE